MGRPARRGLSSCAAVLVATGCAQLAGIDETSGLVPPDRVSLQVDRVSIGASVVRAPQELSAQTASFLVPDDAAPEGFTRVPAELTDVGLWTAEVPAGTPAVQFDLPDFPAPLQRVWQFETRNHKAVFGVYEHPSPQPAPAGAMLTVTATLPTAYVTGQSFQFASVGTWNARGFTGAELPLVDTGVTTLGPVTFAFTSTSKQTTRDHEKITARDAVLVLRYAAGRLTGVMEAAPFEQTGDDMISGAMTAVPAAEMVSADLQPMLVAGRYMPLRPAMGAPAMAWNLTAAPGVDHAAFRGIQLHSAPVTAADLPLSVAYGNPFVAKGWRSVFLWSTSASRTVTPLGQTLPVTLRAELYTYIEPTPTLVLDLPAGLPELITINGVSLSSDGLTIPKPTQQAKVSFVATGMGTVFQVQLFELAPNMANTALEYRFVIDATGPTKELSLPPEVFVPGKLYTLRAITHASSFPNFADGDLSVRSLPVSTGFHDSGVFMVAP